MLEFPFLLQPMKCPADNEMIVFPSQLQERSHLFIHQWCRAGKALGFTWALPEIIATTTRCRCGFAKEAKAPRSALNHSSRKVPSNPLGQDEKIALKFPFQVRHFICTALQRTQQSLGAEFLNFRYKAENIE